MNYLIEKQLIPLSQKKLTSQSIIIAHESGNANNTGPLSLENEIAYMTRQAANNGAFTSHWIGGGGRIIQIAQVGKMQYGAGKYANPHAYAQVELARTSNPDCFQKDYQAYIWLLRKLAGEAGIPCRLNTGTDLNAKGIKTHHWVSKNLGGTTHSDPDAYLMHYGVSLDQFSKDLSSSPTKTDIPPLPANESGLYYTVVKGDSLWSISKKYQTTLTWLKTANRLSSETIKIGQKLIISLDNNKGLIFTQTDRIKAVQHTIGIPQTGLFDTLTKRELIKWIQKTTGSEVDGYWGPKTASKLRTLKINSIGWDVYVVQAFLLGKNFLIVGTPDQSFGPKTVQATKEFQTSSKLLSDGIVGPLTYQKLFN